MDRKHTRYVGKLQEQSEQSARDWSEMYRKYTRDCKNNLNRAKGSDQKSTETILGILQG